MKWNAPPNGLACMRLPREATVTTSMVELCRIASPHQEIGVLLLNNQRQHRTLHVQKDMLPYALCYQPPGMNYVQAFAKVDLSWRLQLRSMPTIYSPL